MKNFRIAAFVFCLVGSLSTLSFAGEPARGTSNNGTDNDAPFWNLFGPTTALTRDDAAVTLRTQVVCTNQQVASAVDAVDAISDSNAPFADAGSCKDGAYTFLFQIQSTSKNLTMTLSNLVGFTPSATAPPTYGVETCDTPMNTLELCSDPTTLTTAGTAQLANITSTINAANTKIVFCIPKVPAFLAGTGNQGQGLTLVVVTQQTTPLPVAYPKVSFK